MAWHKGKQMQLNNALEISTWRQVLQKETSQLKHKTTKELKEMENELSKKNTYLHLFKNEEKKKQETLDEKTGKNTIFVFDQAKRDEEDRGGYCQRCKRESLWCKDRVCREYPKKFQGAALTSSQVYGWRPPIDSMNTGFARTGICKRTFYDKGHL